MIQNIVAEDNILTCILLTKIINYHFIKFIILGQFPLPGI